MSAAPAPALARRLRIAAMTVFVGLFFLLVFLHKYQVARVLIIHSYNTDYSWVEALNDGFARGFAEAKNVIIRYQYMDLKNHTDTDFLRRSVTLADRVIAEWSPDLLILVDDDAQRHIGAPYLADPDFPHRTVVYAGVNGDPHGYYGDDPRATGILEQKPLTAIRDTARQIIDARYPARDPARPRRVVFIGDRSSSIAAELPFYRTIDWAPLVWLDPILVDSFDEWKAAVARAGTEADLILVTNYQQVRAGPGGPFLRPAAQVMRWTVDHAAVPVLGMGWTNSRDGAMLTVSVSPYEQGETAARLALDALKTPPQGRIVIPRQFLIHACARSLAGSGFDLPILYEAFARATDTYYDSGC